MSVWLFDELHSKSSLFFEHKLIQRVDFVTEGGKVENVSQMNAFMVTGFW